MSAAVVESIPIRHTERRRHLAPLDRYLASATMDMPADEAVSLANSSCERRLIEDPGYDVHYLARCCPYKCPRYAARSVLVTMRVSTNPGRPFWHTRFPTLPVALAIRGNTAPVDTNPANGLADSGGTALDG